MHAHAGIVATQAVPAPQVRYWRPGTRRYLYIRKTKLASDDAATDQLASMYRPLYAQRSARPKAATRTRSICWHHFDRTAIRERHRTDGQTPAVRYRFIISLALHGIPATEGQISLQSPAAALFGLLLPCINFSPEQPTRETLPSNEGCALVKYAKVPGTVYDGIENQSSYRSQNGQRLGFGTCACPGLQPRSDPSKILPANVPPRQPSSLENAEGKVSSTPGPVPCTMDERYKPKCWHGSPPASSEVLPWHHLPEVPTCST
jgi:hypothetical protein